MRTFKRQGFTLIELMVALTILSLSMGAIYLSFSSGLSAWERGEETMATFQAMRRTLELLTREIRSSYTSPGNKEIKLVGLDRQSAGNDTDELTYFTLSGPRPNGRIGLYRIKYYLAKETGATHYSLYREELPSIGKFILGEKVTQPLLREVSGLNFRYYRGDKWEDSWHSTALPGKIKITITLAKGKKETSFSAVTDLPLSGAIHTLE